MMKRGWTFLIWLYLFIISIELIKISSLSLSNFIHPFLNSSLTPIKALSIGWFITEIIQSGSALVGGLVAPFVSNNLLSLVTAMFVIMGAKIGATGTALLISILIGVKKKKRDFRHGFEIGLVYILFSIFTIIICFFLEYFFHLFSKLSLFFADIIGTNVTLSIIPNFIKFITEPVTSIINLIPSKIIVFLLAFAILLLSLRFFTKDIINFLGGENEARKFINKHFKSKFRSFTIGLLFTMLVFSTAISISLLVPLAVSRLINLKKAIPFIIGAALGTSIDVIIPSLVIGTIPAFAVAIAHILFGVLGAIIFLPNTNLLFNITKFISKRIMHISERKALIFIIIFILIPLLIYIL